MATGQVGFHEQKKVSIPSPHTFFPHRRSMPFLPSPVAAAPNTTIPGDPPPTYPAVLLIDTPPPRTHPPKRHHQPPQQDAHHRADGKPCYGERSASQGPARGGERNQEEGEEGGGAGAEGAEGREMEAGACL